MINYETYQQSKATRKDRMSELQRQNQKYKNNCLKNPTKTELIVKEFLEKNKIRFMFQKGFITPFHRIVDFYLPGRSIIIEVDGSYHYFIQDKDSIKDRRWLEERNMRTLRLKNEEVYDKSYERKILKFISIES